MKRALLSFLGLALMVTGAYADAVTDFIKVRKTQKLTSTVSTDALNSLIGTKTFEIRATIKGVVRIGSDCALLLENVDGSSLMIRSKALPDWIVDGGAQAVRLIVTASRPQEYAELQANLLAAVPEARILPYDVKPGAATTTAKTTSKTNSSKAPLFGNIGRGGTKLESRGGAPRGPRKTVSAQEALPEYAAFIKNYNKKLADAKCYEIAESVIKFSVQYGLDARLIMAIAIAESGFNPNATSHAGAQGLLQLMPGTAAGLGVRNSYDVTDNVFGAVKLMKGHLEKYHKQTNGDPEQTLILALAAYNAGGGAVKKHGGVPPYKETQNYVRKVVGIYYQLAS